MLVCPRCRSEYVSGIARCAPCGADLVEESTLEAGGGEASSPREALAAVEKAFLPTRNLDAARDLERDLLAKGILCYVHAEQTEGAILSAGTLQYAVVVAHEDISAVKEHFEGRARGLLEEAGLAALASAAIDLEADEVTCPACGHSGALDDAGACADCGLVLGVE